MENVQQQFGSFNLLIEYPHSYMDLCHLSRRSLQKTASKKAPVFISHISYLLRHSSDFWRTQSSLSCADYSVAWTWNEGGESLVQ